MNRAEKVELANSLKDKFSKAGVAVFADYKGLQAADADQLRKGLRTHNVEVKVLKNNIARQAVADGALGEDIKKLMDGLVGPTLVAFAYGDAAAAAKEIHKFSEDHEEFELKTSIMGEKVIQAAEIEQLAKLPSREALLGMLLSTMNGPARGFVSVLAAVPRSFVTVLSAIKDKKETDA